MTDIKAAAAGLAKDHPNPAQARQSHYFHARLARQFDALVWFARTGAVRPLVGAPPEGEPDIYPFGL